MFIIEFALFIVFFALKNNELLYKNEYGDYLQIYFVFEIVWTGFMNIILYIYISTFKYEKIETHRSVLLFLWMIQVLNNSYGFVILLSGPAYQKNSNNSESFVTWNIFLALTILRLFYFWFLTIVIFLNSSLVSQTGSNFFLME